MKNNTTHRYIPDHIRLNRTDRLVHVKESLQLVYRRKLPKLWEDRSAYEHCLRLHLEISLIDAELHRRHMATRPAQRSMRQPAYITNRS